MGAVKGMKRSASSVRFVPLTYNPAESQTSALRLVLSILPDWEHTDGSIEFVRFTDGITNTLLKVINKRPGLSVEEVDKEAVLLRAYGQGTDLIIDREREAQNHELLTQFDLAPQLLARFHNGMLYRFISGAVTSPADLRRPSIYRGVARRLAEWHALVPCLATPRRSLLAAEAEGTGHFGLDAPTPSKKDLAIQAAIDSTAPGKPAPNVWTVMQKWIYALPAASAAEKLRQAKLQTELSRLVGEFSERPGFGQNGLVFAHNDLLSGNVIVEPRLTSIPAEVETVSFIDYEYATPSPAAFDIANHFAEWGGFDCEHQFLPTQTQRLEFIREYVRSYFAHLGQECDEEAEVRQLFSEVDLYRAVPGFYWGIWALIQATISQIDFDYAAYAEIRLGEYWAWREENDGSRASSGKEMPLRERRWAQKA